MSPVAPNKRANYNLSRIFVIIPAAGLSTRMESDVNKQIMEIDGITVIERTLGAFQKFGNSLAKSGITLRAVVVTSAELVYKVNGLCRYNKFEFVQSVVAGGDSRMESVWKGIEALSELPFPPNDNDIVFIHDGARCLVDQPTLERCLEGAMKYDICAAAVPVKSTIKQTKKKDVFEDIPTVDAVENEPVPETPVVEEEPEKPMLRAAFEDREPSAPSQPAFSSLMEFMENRKQAELEAKQAEAKKRTAPAAKKPSPFEAPQFREEDEGIRLEKVVSNPNAPEQPAKKPVFEKGMDYISKLPSLAERLGGAVMSATSKQELKKQEAAAEAERLKKEEAEKKAAARKKTPYVRPDSPFKRIDINEINTDDEEPEVDEEVEQEVSEPETSAPSPFKKIDVDKIDPDEGSRRPAARPPVTRPASAVRPAARPPVTRPASAVRPAARPPVTRPASAARPAAASKTAEKKAATRPAARPAASAGRPGSAASRSTGSAFRNGKASPEVVSTPDRDELMEVQTPQVFRFDKLIDSYVNGIRHNLNATDDTSLAEAIHLKVHLVEGSYTNIKITTKEDIDYAEMILKRQAEESAE